MFVILLTDAKAIPLGFLHTLSPERIVVLLAVPVPKFSGKTVSVEANSLVLPDSLLSGFLVAIV